MNEFNPHKHILIACIITVTSVIHADEADYARKNMGKDNRNILNSESYDSTTNDISHLKNVLDSDNTDTEKLNAIRALGSMQSQLAARVLLDNLLQIKSTVRKGPQMNPEIGMYPSALALVDNGTNSIIPVVEFIRYSDSHDVQRLCQEILIRIESQSNAVTLINQELRDSTEVEEQYRLQAALKFLLKNDPVNND